MSQCSCKIYIIHLLHSAVLYSMVLTLQSDSTRSSFFLPVCRFVLHRLKLLSSHHLCFNLLSYGSILICSKFFSARIKNAHKDLNFMCTLNFSFLAICSGLNGQFGKSTDGTLLWLWSGVSQIPTNLFLTLKSFWSPDWNPPMRDP